MNKAQQAFEKERRGVPPAPVVAVAATKVEPESSAADLLDFALLRNAIDSLQSRCSSLENRVSTLEKEHADALSAAVERVEADHA